MSSNLPTSAQIAGEAALARAQGLAIAVPLVLLGGALAFQFFAGLYPCEMCWWQRYGHIAAVIFSVMAVMLPGHRRLFVALAGLGIASSALIGGYHAGVEYGWWQGFTACTSTVKFGGGADPLAAIMQAPVVRCDEVQWKLFGISLAGYNFLASGAAAVAVFALLARSGKKG